jgi:hypothetical protein
MVFTETARRMVVEQQLVDAERVRVVPHGAPDELTAAAWSDRVSDDISTSSLQLGLPSLAGRAVLSTFGLISDSKGSGTGDSRAARDHCSPSLKSSI